MDVAMQCHWIMRFHKVIKIVSLFSSQYGTQWFTRRLSSQFMLRPDVSSFILSTILPMACEWCAISLLL